MFQIACFRIDILKSGKAIIYSGVFSTLKRNLNVDFFTPDDPEEPCLLVAYDFVLIRASKIDSQI